ncbi:ABC transporter permease, partial [Candidatus Babeliales bacterium]|nr:ABC transporter permease [Candidatus Babeliales bacterium]
MKKIFQFNFDIFKQLMLTKFTNLKSTFKDKLINFYIWAASTIFVTGYIMQAFGLSQDFGAFQLGGVLASVGLFELYTNAVTFVSDLEGDRSIDYYLTLPTSVFTVFFSYIVYYASISLIIGIILLPLAKAILLDKLVLSNIAWFKLLFFTVLINLICATATLLLSALTPAIEKLDILFVRFIFPLWYFGGFQYSWFSLNEKVPWLSYIMLINPMTYATEGMRAALL